jgi:hypothetical protein
MMLRKAPVVLVLGTFAGPASGTTLLYEPFDYASVGTEISTADGAGGWLKVTSGATAEPTVGSGSLSYVGLPFTPVGNKVVGSSPGTGVLASSTLSIPGAPYVSSAEPTLYYSLLLNVTNVTGLATGGATGGSFIAGFRSTTGTGGLAGGEGGAPLLLRQTASGSGAFYLGTGLTQDGADRTWDENTSYTAATGPLLLVFSYQFVAGDEDFARLWVNPDPTMDEASNAANLKVTATATDGQGITGAQITNFFLRNNGSAPDGWEIDELRVSTSWEGLWGTSVPGIWLGGTGNWSDSTKWSSAIVPNVASLPVQIDNRNSAASNVTLDQDVTVRSITLNADDTFTIPAGRSLNLAAAGSNFSGIVNHSGTLTAPGVTVSGAGGEFRWIDGVVNVGSAQLTDGGKLIMSPGGNKVLKVASASVDVADGSKVDLADNKLITSGALGTWNGTNYTGLSGLVDSGRGSASNAQWDGNGIVTTDTRAVNNNDLVSIGTAKFGDLRNIADTATTTFAGQTVLGSDSVAMVTWGGDANLDGKINIDDYGQIDFNVGSSGSVFGWFNGDFNYDGKINIDDYGIIDFNVAAQGAPFLVGTGATATAAGLGVTSVPEPATLSVLALGAATLLRRHRRRRGR